MREGLHNESSDNICSKYIIYVVWLITVPGLVRSDENITYSKTCVKPFFSKWPKLVFKTNYRLMQVKSIAECSKGSILQYIRPSLNYHLSLRSLFCLFLSDRFTQVLLYIALLSRVKDVGK